MPSFILKAVVIAEQPYIEVGLFNFVQIKRIGTDDLMRVHPRTRIHQRTVASTGPRADSRAVPHVRFANSLLDAADENTDSVHDYLC